MVALTIQQPFASVIALGVKRVENRNWPPPDWLLGGRFVVHAGKTWDEVGWRFCRDLGCEVPRDAPRGAVVAVVRLREVRQCSYAEACESNRPDPWFVGPVGWFLGDVVALPRPVACRGRQSLWSLPREAEAEVQAQMSERGR